MGGVGWGGYCFWACVMAFCKFVEKGRWEWGLGWVAIASGHE